MPQVYRVRSAADLGRAVKGAREAAGLTQQELADLVAVDRSYLARIETGLSVLLLERMLRMLRRLGAEVSVTVPDEHGQRVE